MTPQDKRYDEYRRKCAEVDGLQITDNGNGVYPRYIAHSFWVDDKGNRAGIVKESQQSAPTYLDDASIDAVVRKLDDEQFQQYVIEIDWAINNPQMGDYEWNIWEVMTLLKAAPEQKAEALCRTLIGGDE